MIPFDFYPRTRLVFGPGTVHSVGEHASQLGLRRLLLVCDPGIMATPHPQTVIESLKAAGITVETFSDFGQNPSTVMVDRGVAAAAAYQPDGLIGLGGGSSMDCCKGINFVFSCGGTMSDYKGIGKATSDLLPLIAIPTTAGTGSEVQSFAIISDPETHVKMACGDKRAAPKVSILDPELTLSQPPQVTRLTAIDAVSHALETYVSKRRNEISKTFSRQAFGLLGSAIETVFIQPDDLAARSAMLLGASLSGLAIENSMLGAAHATANPLTARHDVVHGQAVGLMLPAVIRLNATRFPDAYAELLREIEPSTTSAGASDANASSPAASSPLAADRLAWHVSRWVELAGLKTKLVDLGIAEASIDDMVPEALEQWTGTFNPVALDADVVRKLYQESFA
ncbi:MAG: iron-containing alcohol dehydrogenase [Planctomycetota bacterium]